FDDAVPGGNLQTVNGGVGGDGGFAIGGGNVFVAGLHTLQCALFEGEGVHDPVPGLRGRGALEVIGKKEFLLPGDGFGRDGGQIRRKGGGGDERKSGEDEACVHKMSGSGGCSVPVLPLASTSAACFSAREAVCLDPAADCLYRM